MRDLPAPRQTWLAIGRGLKLRCPCCGQGRLFTKYLKIADTCGICREALFHHQADDAPAYFTMAVVGHIVVGLALWLEIVYAPPLWLHGIVWLPLSLLLSLGLLPMIKGSIVALQWALRMHGFGAESDPGSNPF